jgi:hypothetical protein
MLGFGLSFIIQSIFQGWFAKHSYWKRNIGWQNEIAIWNLGMITILYGVTKNLVSATFEVLLGLFILSLLFFLNHTSALFKAKYPLSNLMGSAINLIGITLILLHWIDK